MRNLLLICLAVTLIFTFSCSEEYEPERDYTPYFRAERFEAPDGVILGYNLRRSGGEMLIEAFTSEKFTDENGRADRQRRTVRVELATGEVSVSADSSKTLGVFEACGDRFEVEAEYGDSSYESVTIKRFHGDKLKETLDASEVFGVDIRRLKINLAGEGGFNMLAVGEHDGEPVYVSNLGVSSGGRIYSSKEELTSAIVSGGRLMLISEKDGRGNAMNFDFDSFEPTEIDFPERFVGDFMFLPLAVDGYDIAVRVTDGIYGMNFDADGKLVPELIFDFAGSDVPGMSIGSTAAVSATEFWLVEYDFTLDYGDPDRTTIWKMTAIPTDEYAPKTELRLLCLGDISQSLERGIVNFNRANDKFRVKPDLREIGENEDYSAFLTRISAELSGGDLPDGVFISGFFGIDPATYERQGLFCDLYALMDEAGFDKNNLLECQTESFTTKNTRTGKDYLPYIALSAGIKTIVSERGDLDGRLTLGMILDKIEAGELPYQPSGGSKTFGKRELVNTILYHDLDEFLDGRFDSELFRRFVSVYRGMSELEGETTCYERNFGQLGSVWNGLLSLKSDFGDCNIAGYPGNGVSLEVNEYFGITEKSTHKSEMFSFLAGFLTDESAVKISKSAIPVLTKSGLDAAISRLDKYHAVAGRSYMSAPTPFTDEEKKDFEKQGSALYFELDDEFIAVIKELVGSARAESALKSDIMSVIREELSAEHQSVDEICAFIDDRVGTIVSERE